jgi:hypothetical protein
VRSRQSEACEEQACVKSVHEERTAKCVVCVWRAGDGRTVPEGRGVVWCGVERTGGK